MRHFIRIDSFLQRFRNMGLADDVFKAFGPPFTV